MDILFDAFLALDTDLFLLRSIALEAEMKLCRDETDSPRDRRFKPSSFNFRAMLVSYGRDGGVCMTDSTKEPVTELPLNELRRD
jgi:hypothetical protein